MSFYETMQEFGLPIFYAKAKNEEDITPPFLVYLEDAPEVFYADNKRYYKSGVYSLELYFKDKDKDLEDRLEKFLESKGYDFTISEDIFLEEEDILVKYYEVLTYGK